MCACLGVINMSQVLQRQMEQELELVDSKAGGVVLGKVNTFYSIIVFFCVYSALTGLVVLQGMTTTEYRRVIILI